MPASEDPYLKKEHRLIFWLCFILIAGMGMSAFFDFTPATATVDHQSYLQMARLDFNTSLHRRYRFVIPMLAGGINFILQKPAQLINPRWLTGDFTLRLSFYLVNLTLAAFWCSLIYRYCKAYGMSRTGAFLGLLAVVTSRWTMMHAGTPHTDLLFCLAIICMLYGIKTKRTFYLMLAILLGPFSKESFLFAAPVLFFSYVPRWKTALCILGAGALVFLSRYVIDRSTGTAMSDSLLQDAGLLQVIFLQFTRLKTFSYWLEIFATVGLWWVLPVLQKAVLKEAPETAAYLKQPYVLVFLATSAFQIVLNGELARMMYMLMPVYAVVVGFAAERLYRYYFMRGT